MPLYRDKSIQSIIGRFKKFNFACPRVSRACLTRVLFFILAKQPLFEVPYLISESEASWAAALLELRSSFRFKVARCRISFHIG